jgi:hypothetical protein
MPTPTDSPIRRFAVAAWGVCWGVLLATATTTAMIAVKGDTQDHNHASLLQSDYLTPYARVPWQEHYEQSWYVLLCICGALCGWAATRFTKPSPWLVLLTMCFFIPAATDYCRGVFGGKLVPERFFRCAGMLLVPLAGAMCRSRIASGGVLPERPSPVVDAPRSPAVMWLTSAMLAVPLMALLYGVYAPADLTSTAWQCNVESHVASYLIGPAQYYRAPGVVPGLDFESHYGIGHAYAFSLVMGDGGYHRVLERFVLFVLVVSLAYFLSAHLVLTDWLGNPVAAFLVTLLLAVFAVEGLGYQMPSCWPVRHPFAFAFLFCAVRGVESSRWCLAAGAVGGLSLFWQTDIGLFTLAAGGALYLANAVFLGGAWSKPGVFLAMGLGTFLAICLVLFGPRVLDATFVQRLCEPLMLYATGFGTTLMTWRTGWNSWFNLIGPGIAIASVAAFIGYGRRGVPPRGVVYAAVTSLLGLAMLTKWVNRSIDIVWALNGGLVLAAAGWWTWTAWRSGTAGRSVASRLATGTALVGLLVLGVKYDAKVAQPHPLLRTTSPLVRIADRLDSFPNPINAARKEYPPTEWPTPFDEEAIAYLRERTNPTERVTVISRHDWNFLAAAGRAPRLSWQPFFLVHSPVLLDRCTEDLRNSDRVFVDENALLSLSQIHPGAYQRVAPVMAELFAPVEHVGRWTLYVRKPGM